MNIKPSIAALVASTCFLTGCNLFAPFTANRDDQANLEKARGCLDRGDYECARSAYAKLEGTSLAETAASEQAFADLDEAGAGAETLFPALAQGKSAGDKVTLLAESLAKKDAYAQRRLLLSAYSKVDSITTNTSLRGLIRFLSGFALTAAILSTEVDADGVLRLVGAENAASCFILGCTGNSACEKPSPAITAGAALDLLTSPFPGVDSFDLETPTWGFFQAALSAAREGLTELGASGSFTDGAAELAFAFATLDPAAGGADRCFRAEAVSQEIGAAP